MKIILIKEKITKEERKKIKIKLISIKKRKKERKERKKERKKEKTIRRRI